MNIFGLNRILSIFALILLSIFHLLPTPSLARIEFPKNMNSEDRQSVTRMLGFGMSSKILSDPYALGGFAGFEFGVGYETVPTQELSRKGNRAPAPESVSYPKISVGKGLYYNVDTFVHFIPFDQSTGLTEYGGIIRWSFHQMQNAPITFSLLGAANNTNIMNEYLGQTARVDLIAGMNANEFSAYIGTGHAWSKGTFMGGPTGTTDTGYVETENVEGSGAVIGAVYHFKPMFMAFQLDYFLESVISAKFGMRY